MSHVNPEAAAPMGYGPLAARTGDKVALEVTLFAGGDA